MICGPKTKLKSKELRSNLADDITDLSGIPFTKHAIDDDSLLKLFHFCNATQHAYGFVVHGDQNWKSHIAFGKIKLSPMKVKTLRY